MFLFCKGFLKTSLKFSTSICKELKYIVYSDCCLQGGVQYHCVHCALSTCFECTNLSILECIVHSSSSAALCRPVPWPRWPRWCHPVPPQCTGQAGYTMQTCDRVSVSVRVSVSDCVSDCVSECDCVPYDLTGDLSNLVLSVKSVLSSDTFNDVTILTPLMSLCGAEKKPQQLWSHPI